jgi:hypothetical protein
VGSAWFSGEETKKGAIAAGQLADLAVLSANYFAVPEDEIKGIESLLTIVGGAVVHAAGQFASLTPPPLPVLPEWSPVAAHRGFHRSHGDGKGASASGRAGHSLLSLLLGLPCAGALWGAAGCDCFVM